MFDPFAACERQVVTTELCILLSELCIVCKCNTCRVEMLQSNLKFSNTGRNVLTLARFVGSGAHFPDEILVNSCCKCFVYAEPSILVVYACQRAKLRRALSESFVTEEIVTDIQVLLRGLGLVFRLVVSEVINVSDPV